MTSPDLDPVHAAVAEAARTKVIEYIHRGKVVVAEIVVGNLSDEIPVEDLRF